MVLLFPEIDTQINLHAQMVVIAGEEHKVRPKTFQLLMSLIDAEGELVSKEALLNTVWDDVVVDEQVIFQSIKELRKLFPGQTAIKTVPRKGYAWLPKANAATLEPASKTGYEHPVNFKLYLTATVAVAMLVVAIVLARMWSEPEPTPVSGSIVVLPVQSEITSNDLDWVRYGIMDQVISRLKSTEQAGVLQTDYVLDVMARAKVSLEQVSQGQVEPIFEVSGAELILAMRLTGNPKDYQIVYTLYQRGGIEKGAVLDDSVQDAADQVAQIVGNRITPGFVLPQHAYVSSFADRLIAEALEAKSKGDIKGTLELLEAALVAAPDNLVAARLLLQTRVETGASHSYIEAIALPALALAQQKASKVDQIRLGFWLAVSESINGDAKQGLARFNQVEQLATAINDWLYLAYVAEIRGQFHQSQQDFTLANDHFQQAMHYHRILHCPLGQSNTLMHLSRLAHAQQNPALAIDQAQQALDLMQTRNLTNKLPVAQDWLEQLTTGKNAE